MANVSITTRCNRACRYCFARDAVGVLPRMSLQAFDAALDRLQQDGVDQVRLLGGEPTLHPQFSVFVDRALARGLRLMIFSNGLMPERAAARLEMTEPERVRVLVNVALDDARDLERQRASFRRLGPRILPGANIDTPAAPLETLLDLIAEYGLAKCVRLGLAHPRVGGDNAYLPPRLYAAAGVRVAAFAMRARQAGVEIELDCGFVPCMFPPGTLEVAGLGERCNALPDLLPDGTAIACYPLAGVWRGPAGRPLAEIGAEAEEALAPYRTIGIFAECSACALRKSGACRGGCLAAAMRRTRTTPSVTSPVPRAPSPLPSRWSIPYVDQPLDFWERVNAEFGEHIREVYFPMPGGIVASGRPPQPDAHLQEFLRWGRLGRALLINPIVLATPVERVVDALRRFAGEYGVAAVTVADLDLARRIRAALPSMSITASTLMDIGTPHAAAALDGVCDHLVPASAIMRDLPKLGALRAAFRGRIRLLVNESCLSGCTFRDEHFRQMAGPHPHPASLCEPLLSREPWRRLTGAFVLPQHLHLYDGLYDDLKLAGRVTLRDEADYVRVLGAYIHRRPVAAADIGGGPASLLDPIPIGETFYRRTLQCGHRCDGCTFCRDTYAHATARAS